MKKVNLAIGTLVLIGLLLIISGLICKVSGLNLLEPLFSMSRNYFPVANTCFLLALIIDRLS